MREVERDLNPIGEFPDRPGPRAHPHCHRGFPPDFTPRIPDPLKQDVRDLHRRHGGHGGPPLSVPGGGNEQKQGNYSAAG